jgi:pSer/pThr/pTyr-binding forkhead associated (FHA) protein
VGGEEKAWLETRSRDGTIIRYPIRFDRIRIGASEESDIVVSDDASLSRLHAEVSSEGEKFYVMDMGSLNGTRLNDVVIPPREALEIHEGDKIQAGSWTAILHLSESVSRIDAKRPHDLTAFASEIVS